MCQGVRKVHGIVKIRNTEIRERWNVSYSKKKKKKSVLGMWEGGMKETSGEKGESEVQYYEIQMLYN